MASDAKFNTPLTIQETDEAENPIVTYIVSGQDTHKSASSGGGRVDILSTTSNPSLLSAKPLIASFSEVFLPSGYPQSVSDDYLPYQIFDSLQAFCSSIAGLLSSRAVLQGVGVGNADASPTSALLLHILQDTSGRIATILFAHRVGTALEPECKTYRLAADVFNDFAMILDCLSPMVPAGVMRVSVLSAAGVLRALCGVAGGSSKASLSAHFAKWGNLAELNAKDSSQETVISLVGMLVGSVVVSHVTGFTATWISLLTLLALHLSLNYAAVRSVQMTSLNRQRANIVLSALLESDTGINLTEKSIQSKIETRFETDTSTHPHTWKVLTPSQVSSQERIFHRGGTLQWTHFSRGMKTYLGSAEIGISLDTFFKHAQRHYPKPTFPTSGGGSTSFQTALPLHQITTLFNNESYILFLFPSPGTPSLTWHASILLKKGCPVTAQLKGWAHALLAARVLSESSSNDSYSLQTGQNVFDVVASVLDLLNRGDRFAGYVAALKKVGWDVDVGALETRGRRRVSFE
ncbi:RUS1 family protein [Penicillium rolfsii]|nr:RUS1 family protein [Penicillium rolfsii]